MGVLPVSARALLNSGVRAHVSTINANGSPHVTVVWIASFRARFAWGGGGSAGPGGS